MDAGGGNNPRDWAAGGRNIKMLQAAAMRSPYGMVSDQLTGLLEVRARTDQSALAGEDMIAPSLGTWLWPM
ncbi:hypothetical protein WJX82_004001 [Trebouxia sp. C0006]